MDAAFGLNGAMDKYRRVEKARREEDAGPNEVRITQQGKVRAYITYASSLLAVSARSRLVGWGWATTAVVFDADVRECL